MLNDNYRIACAPKTLESIQNSIPDNKTLKKEVERPNLSGLKRQYNKSYAIDPEDFSHHKERLIIILISISI
jgi:hypothetical protein